MSQGHTVFYESKDALARITIDREERRNALNPQVIAELADALRRAEGEDDVRAVVLTGAGDKAFCAGGDLGGTEATGGLAQQFVRRDVGELFKQMHASRLPIVARVNGHALAGGFGLMLACDLVVATDDAQMGTPEVNLGLWPFMISAVIHRNLPRKVALELMLTGRRISAEEGRRWGFVNRVVPRASLDEAVDEMSTSLTSKSPLIMALGKRSFYGAGDMSFDQGLEYLAGMLTVCLESEDTLEGVSAFFQKRAPVWKGR